MLSGFFAGRFAQHVRRPNILHFLKQKLNTLIVPFFVWNLILLLLLARTVPFSPGEVLYNLLTGVWQLYYIFVLIQLLLLHFFVQPYFREERVNLLLGLSAGVSFLFYVFAECMLWTKGLGSEFVEGHLIKIPLPWVIFFALGMWLRSRMWFLGWLATRLSWLILITAAAHALYWWELKLVDNWLGYNPFLQFPLGGLPYRILAPLLLLVIPFRLADRSSRRIRGALTWIASFGKYTYAIYLSHVAFLIIFFMVLKVSLLRMSGDPVVYWTGPPVLFVAVWVACLAMLGVIRKLRIRWIGRLLYGSIPKEPQRSGEFL
jgi:membrane-bound acyltransferase YfiQ involved in biofilm formation